MTPSRTIVVAGAGIGGLTAALALAAKNFNVLIVEKAQRLEEAGAGLQLSPNASRVLVDLGLRPRLEPAAITPDAVTIYSARSGGELVRLPLGEAAALRAGAPYWVMHRADLQSALAAQLRAHPNIELRLGWQFEEVDSDANGVMVTTRNGLSRAHQQALALVGADGIWSAVRRQLLPDAQPRFSGLIAWRGTFDAGRLPGGAPLTGVQLWMGRNAHLIAYPISAGRRINIVAIVPGTWNRPGWSAPGEPREIKSLFAPPHWPAAAGRMIGAVEGWRRWALFTMPDGGAWVHGAAALLGDAAHGMLPFAAQGAGMAIEDAAVLAQCLGDVTTPEAVPAALQRYATLRQPRVTRVQRTARQNGQIYHLAGAAALARDLAMRALGGQRLLARQSWIYDWRL
ncbi:salicylate hydroxylase [Rhodopseudomonas rhenobacensis]|uniref:Salicylate hydroxylase n=1 Tax=Rhodopseudomonas rhenobacensis TaxID=87461 RepID=A0A7W8E0V7_9BRAD|nr:FAD-dependent monooxygenase [Rhodopseudomonas rhenobacensis]MBB5049864.1 salicylate hydroxylase [Rhodopseudomonas rhenobacensis]